MQISVVSCRSAALLLLVLSSAVGIVWSQCFTGRDGNTPPNSEDLEKFSNGSVDFAMAFFKAVSRGKTKADDNVFVSPFSVHSALTITYIGTKGDTKTELENALHLSSSNQRLVIDTYHEYKDNLVHNATERANYTLSTANRLYFDHSIRVRHCIAASVNNEIETLDFQSSWAASREIINRWVEGQTNNLIKNLLPEDTINSRTRLVVVNAAYFRGYWSSQFKEWSTTKRDFFVNAANKIEVDTMNQVSSYLIAKDPSLRCSAIELPYSGGDVSMVILLPDEGVQVEDVTSRLSQDRLVNLYALLKPNLVNLWLPKFKLEQGIDLGGVIRSLGIVDLFDVSTADLTGFTRNRVLMTTDTKPRRTRQNENLFVSTVVHKTYIAVDEGGTEAAAATAVIGSVITSLNPERPIPIDFEVNRPFVFYIRHRKSNSVLFIGIIRDPSKAE